MEQNTPNNNPYNTPDAELRQAAGYMPVAELKHSGLGITSFVLSIVCGLGLLICIVVAGVLSLDGEMDENSMEAILLGFSILALIFVDLVALIFGLIGWTQKNRKSIFGILGTVFSGLTLLGMIGIIILGLVIG